MRSIREIGDIKMSNERHRSSVAWTLLSWVVAMLVMTLSIPRSLLSILIRTVCPTGAIQSKACMNGLKQIGIAIMQDSDNHYPLVSNFCPKLGSHRHSGVCLIWSEYGDM